MYVFGTYLISMLGLFLDCYIVTHFTKVTRQYEGKKLIYFQFLHIFIFHNNKQTINSQTKQVKYLSFARENPLRPPHEIGNKYEQKILKQKKIKFLSDGFM